MSEPNDSIPEIAELHTLVDDLHTKFEDVQKGRLTQADIADAEKKLNDRIDELETKLQRPRLSQAEEKSKAVTAHRKSLNDWLRKGDKMAPESAENLLRFGSIKGDTLIFPDEQKVLVISDDTLGGYLAQDEYVQEIIKGVTDISPMRQVAKVRSTSMRSVQQPKRTGQPTGVWVGEIDTRTETTGLTYGLETLVPNECYADIRVSKHDLEDSSFNLEAEIRSEAILALAKLEGTAFITGDAVKKPEGITVNATNIANSVKTGSNTAIQADQLIQFTYTVKEPYARNGKYLMKRDTVRQIRQLKDGSNRYLWEPSFAPGQPQTLLGYPIIEMPDMPTVAQNAYAVAFGDFQQHYLIVDRVQVEIQRLVELYAASGQVGFLFRKRVDGQVMLPEAAYLHKVSA